MEGGKGCDILGDPKHGQRLRAITVEMVPGVRMSSVVGTSLALACSSASPQSGPPRVVGTDAAARPLPAAPSPEPEIAANAPARAAAAEGPAGSGDRALPGTASEPRDHPEPAFFPPRDLVPPFAASAHAGDGAWRPLGDAAKRERAARVPVFVTATLHPHKVSRFHAVTLVAVDLTKAGLHLVPGTSDVTAAYQGPAPGLIPEPHRPSAIAVFNGGFKANHGRWGFVLGSEVITAPRRGGCQVLRRASGKLEIAPSTEAVSEDLTWLRQTPPCLLENGALHPTLEAGNERPWGGFDPGRRTRRRSALGLDATGRVLFYAAAVEAGPLLMARALAHAGAAHALELDINWYWTRFLLIGEPSGTPEITSTLLPGMEHRKSDYLERPTARDFFYLSAH